MILITLALVAFSFIYIYYKISFNYWKSRNVPTLPASFPFGNVQRVILRYESVNDKVMEVYNAMKKQQHKFAGIYFFSRKVFLPIDSQLINNILIRDFNYFNDRGIHYDEINDPVSAHLFSLHGNKWKILRGKLTPAFTAGKIKYMFNAMKHCGDEMIDVLADESPKQVIDIKEILARFTTDVIGSCAFGLDCNSIKNPDAEFRLMGKRAFTQTPLDTLKMVVIRSFPELARIFNLSIFAPAVSKFFQSVVEDTVTYRELHDITRPDFLQILIQMKNAESMADRLTTNEMAAQAFIFFLAGFETTSTTMSFALFEMAMHDDIQTKARDELMRVVSKYNGELCYDAVAELNYLETVILESLRKYPPAPVFLRKCTQDYHVPGTENLIIKKGLTTLIPAMALHHDPEFFPQPEIFNPDRFNEENKYKIKDHSFMAFGDGPRICIGMRFAMVQSKLALAQILQNFKFSLSEQTKLPLVMEKKGIVLTPIGGIWLDMKPI